MMCRVEYESEDGEFPMHEGDWGDRESKEFEWLVGLDDVGDERSDEGSLDVLVGFKDVLIDAGERGHGVLIGVDVDGEFHDLVEAPDFVKAEGMVDMVVCIEDGVDARDILSE